MKRKGFTLIELLIVVAIIAILAAIAVPNFLEAQVRSKVSRVRTDHRSLATAIESYYVDNNSYPVYSNAKTDNVYASAPAGKLTTCRSFRIKTATALELLTLTTPIAYITSYFGDPFADTKGASFLYKSQGIAGWILGSFGPDTDQESGGGQLNWCASAFPRGTSDNPNGQPGVETAYDPVNISQPSLTLICGGGTKGAFTYDPTNGTVSSGDLWRVKQ